MACYDYVVACYKLLYYGILYYIVRALARSHSARGLVWSMPPPAHAHAHVRIQHILGLGIDRLHTVDIDYARSILQLYTYMMYYTHTSGRWPAGDLRAG